MINALKIIDNKDLLLDFQRSNQDNLTINKYYSKIDEKINQNQQLKNEMNNNDDFYEKTKEDIYKLIAIHINNIFDPLVDDIDIKQICNQLPILDIKIINFLKKIKKLFDNYHDTDSFENVFKSMLLKIYKSRDFNINIYLDTVFICELINQRLLKIKNLSPEELAMKKSNDLLLIVLDALAVLIFNNKRDYKKLPIALSKNNELIKKESLSINTMCITHECVYFGELKYSQLKTKYFNNDSFIDNNICVLESIYKTAYSNIRTSCIITSLIGRDDCNIISNSIWKSINSVPLNNEVVNIQQVYDLGDVMSTYNNLDLNISNIRYDFLISSDYEGLNFDNEFVIDIKFKFDQIAIIANLKYKDNNYNFLMIFDFPEFIKTKNCKISDIKTNILFDDTLSKNELLISIFKNIFIMIINGVLSANNIISFNVCKKEYSISIKNTNKQLL